jgi:hypothetical protein
LVKREDDTEREWEWVENALGRAGVGTEVDRSCVGC